MCNFWLYDLFQISKENEEYEALKKKRTSLWYNDPLHVFSVSTGFV